MQSVEDLGAASDEFIPMVAEQPQGFGLLVLMVWPVGSRECSNGHRVGIDLVGLATVSGGQLTYSTAEFGRNVNGGDVIGDQPLGQWAAETVAAFDGPPVVGPSAGQATQFAVAGSVC